MRPEAQASVLEHMDLGRASRLANRLPFNTLARVLDHMAAHRRDEIVLNLRPLKRSRVETVLAGRLQ
jgi:Mg/Co/Ni transporter MgtE